MLAPLSIPPDSYRDGLSGNRFGLGLSAGTSDHTG